MYILIFYTTLLKLYTLSLDSELSKEIIIHVLTII